MSGSLLGRLWWRTGFSAGCPHRMILHILGRSASGPPPAYFETPPWHHGSYGAAAACDAMEENDSTEVQYKIRQWSLLGDTIVPVLNVTSRVFWLELDDKALLDSYGVL